MSDTVPNALSTVIADFEKAPTLRSLQEKVDRLPISADAKSLLVDVARVTLEVGTKTIAFGRKILAIAIDLAAKFQTAVFGVIIALILSLVIATLPVLGSLMSALLTPIMLAFGITMGSLADFRNMAVQQDLEFLKQRMSILAAHA